MIFARIEITIKERLIDFKSNQVDIIKLTRSDI